MIPRSLGDPSQPSSALSWNALSRSVSRQRPARSWTPWHLLLFPWVNAPCTWSVPVRVSSKNYVQGRSEEHTSELQSLAYLVCRLLLEKKKKQLPHAAPRPLPHQ